MPEARPSAIVLDPIGGVSGDMFVAAMLDAFPMLTDPVLATMRGAGLPSGMSVSLVKRRSGGIAASGLTFSGDAGPPSGHYPSFRKRLEDAELGESVRRHALGILSLLAEAEAEVHAVPIDEVHFHEIADWDTQADIVGTAAIIDLLGSATWHCRPLPLGSGTIQAAHGAMPVPAPATASLLQGFAFRADDGVIGERVTPTGAAILRYLKAAEAAPPAGTLIGNGAGAGTREFHGVPNILRALGFSGPTQADEPILIVEFDIDDQTPEEIGIATEHLRAVAGVRDLVTFQGIGKKGRWVQAVRIMTDASARDVVVDAVFRETTTLGLRLREERRLTLARREVTIDDVVGPVRVKVADRPHGRSAKAEADDVSTYAQGATGRARLRKRAVRRALESES